MGKSEIKLFSGSSNPELAQKIAKNLKTKLGKADIKKFANGETYVRLGETVRGKDVFFIQSTSAPVNDNLMELLLLIDAAKRSSAGTINVMMPFYGYSLQDRQTRAREPISAKVVAEILTIAGADRVISIDLHAGQIQGFFSIPFEHVTAQHVIANEIKKKKLKNMIIVSPDAGGAKRARKFAKYLGVPLAIIDKRRPRPGVAETSHVIGDVKGKTAIVLDDMINSGSTLEPVCKTLIEDGAKKIYFCVTHGILCGQAIERIQKAPLEEVIITDTIYLPKEKRIKKLKVLSVSKLLADVVKSVHYKKSVGVLFPEL